MNVYPQRKSVQAQKLTVVVMLLLAVVTGRQKHCGTATERCDSGNRARQGTPPLLIRAVELCAAGTPKVANDPLPLLLFLVCWFGAPQSCEGKKDLGFP